MGGRISEIISVIDAVVSQTNLLALNAAVEIASAGEPGRGFAVVASGVRNLAQHCATGARETKELTETSLSPVEDGAHLVEQSGETLEGIVLRIHDVSTLMEESWATTPEQGAAMRTVNGGVTALDATTQSHARQGSETAALSERVGQPATETSDTMNVLRFPSEPAAGGRRSASADFSPAGVRNETPRALLRASGSTSPGTRRIQRAGSIR